MVDFKWIQEKLKLNCEFIPGSRSKKSLIFGKPFFSEDKNMVKQSFRLSSVLRKANAPIYNIRDGDGDGEALKKKRREVKGPFSQSSSGCLPAASIQVGERNSAILSDVEIPKTFLKIKGLSERETSIPTDLNTFDNRRKLGNNEQERDMGRERGEETLVAVELPEAYLLIGRKEGEGETREERDREIGGSKGITETDFAGSENVEEQGGEKGEKGEKGESGESGERGEIGERGQFGKEDAESVEPKLDLKTGSKSEPEVESGSGLELGSELGPEMVSKTNSIWSVSTMVEGSNEVTNVQIQIRTAKDKLGIRNVGKRGNEGKKEGDESLDLRKGERERETTGSEISESEGKLNLENVNLDREGVEENREGTSEESRRRNKMMRGRREDKETRQGKAPKDVTSTEEETVISKSKNLEGEEEREVEAKETENEIFDIFDFEEVPSEPFAIKQRLEVEMARKKMEKVLLYHTYHLDGATRAADCEEKKSDSEKEKQFCPNFGKCDASKSYMVAKCSNPSLVDNWLHGKPPLNFNQSRKANFTTMAPFQSNLFVLENMYINPKGHVFNSTHNFIFGGCSSLVDMDFVFPADTTFVTKFDVLTTLQTWSGVNFFHTLTETLPDFLALEKLFQKYPTIPVAVKNTQLWGPLPRVLPLVGPSLSSLNLHVVPEKGLFFARRLVVPGHQFCGKPGGSVVRTLRDRFHVGTLGNGSSLLERAKNLSDWTIVVGRRDPGQQRAILQQEILMSELQDRYGRNRVTSFWGNISIIETQQLFRRTILYMGPHGAGMTNLLFMPSKSAVLEIRPNELVNPCYQYMSDRCNIDFYLLLGKGNFTSHINANISEILTLTNEILQWDKMKTSTI